MAAPVHKFISRHWQGRIALVPTILLSLIGLRLLVSSASRLRPPDWPLALFALFTLLSALILLWQITGTLRALRRDSSGLGLTGGAAAILVAFALFIVAELDGYASRAADAGTAIQIAPLPVDGASVHLSGPLTWPLYKQFCTTLLAHPDLETVSLDSGGGLVPVARAMAVRISERGLDTHATGLCASACTLVFMGGSNRSLGPGGALGFHGYALLGYVPGSTAREENRDRVWLAERGVDQAFISKIFATPHDTIWRPDTETLRAAGVLRDGLAQPGSSLLSCEPIPGQAASP